MSNSEKDLRIGVIGAGGRGGLARTSNRPGEGSRVVALCDIREEAYERWHEFCDIRRNGYERWQKFFPADAFQKTSDYRDIFADKSIDAVFITVPDYLHEEIAVAALEAGKTVYLEKPMAITIEGCDRILETAYRTGSKLFVGHNMRHMDFIIKMKEIIDSGAIGNLQAVWCRHFINYGGDAYFKDWHSESKNTTGLLLQKGAHDIDVIHWLSGGYTRRVVGMGKLSVYNRCQFRRAEAERGVPAWSQGNWPPLAQKGISPVINVEDESTLIMQLDNGVMANYMQCHYAPDACRNYTFIGDAGRVENYGDGANRRVDVYTSRGEFGCPDVSFRLSDDGGGHGGADPDIVAAFVKFARNEAVVSSNSPVSARDAVAVGVLGTESLRNGSVPREVQPVRRELMEYFENGQKRN